MDKWDVVKNATITQVRRFQDGSDIRYYDNGYVSISRRPPKFEELGRVPDADLYYWRIMQGMPDVKTWEDITNAEKEMKR
jgi:hypothetical protein